MPSCYNWRSVRRSSSSTYVEEEEGEGMHTHSQLGGVSEQGINRLSPFCLIALLVGFAAGCIQTWSLDQAEKPLPDPSRSLPRVEGNCLKDSDQLHLSLC